MVVGVQKDCKCFDGLSVVNIEITSRCNKNCWMCGRRIIEKKYPELVNWGDMDFSLLEKIAKQLPQNIIVSLHNNGESLLYPRLGDAISLFKEQITHFDTNGKLLVEKADEIIDNLDSLTISVIENDTEGDEQYEIVKKFLEIKGKQKPMVTFRLLGNVDRIVVDGKEEFIPERTTRWHDLAEEYNCKVTTRTIHSPMGSFKYRNPPTILEHGICLDMLSHLSIDRFGRVSPCVRFDPNGYGVIGDANTTPLVDIWNGEKRMNWLKYHKEGRRDKIKFCSYCDFYGVPTQS